MTLISVFAGGRVRYLSRAENTVLLSLILIVSRESEKQNQNKIFQIFWFRR